MKLHATTDVGEEIIVILTRCYLSRNVATVIHTLLHISCGSTRSSSSFIFFYIFWFQPLPLRHNIPFFFFCNPTGYCLFFNKHIQPSWQMQNIPGMSFDFSRDPGLKPEISSNEDVTCMAAAGITNCRCLKRIGNSRQIIWNKGGKIDQGWESPCPSDWKTRFFNHIKKSGMPWIRLRGVVVRQQRQLRIQANQNARTWSSLKNAEKRRPAWF